MAVIASGVLAAAAVVLVASTGGHERSDRDRRSAVSDRSGAEVERGKNGQQDMNHDDYCEAPNNAAAALVS